MKLEYLYLDGYKGLRNIAIEFKKQASPVAIDFFIGRNGAGKSSMLEAIGLIFTRILQNEVPGFKFELKYRISNGTSICIKPFEAQLEDQRNTGQRQKLFIEVEKSGKKEQYKTIPNEYLPDRIISYCSGANNSMEEILISSPKDSLASDLFDIADMDAEEQDNDLTKEVLNYYDQLDINPRALYLDAITSKFILPILFAILPLDLQNEHSQNELIQYCQLRDTLIKRLNMHLIPTAFSFKVNQAMLERCNDSPQINILRQLMENEQDRNDPVCDLVLERPSNDTMEDDGSISYESTVVFLYSQYGNSEDAVYYHPGLQKFFDGDPFLFISTLLTAYQRGVIREIHFCYRNESEKGLYQMEALSDGELMWLARTGLLLLAQSHCGENTLFLYDEPDVHFNDDWNKDFVNIVYELSKGTQHQVLVATHSTLILTDALYEQLHLFENRSNAATEVRSIDISTFAAQRDEISKQVFGTGSIGAYAETSVNGMMSVKDLESMKKNIAKLGPGYHRFRLYEQFYSLLDKVRN